MTLAHFQGNGRVNLQQKVVFSSFECELMESLFFVLVSNCFYGVKGRKGEVRVYSKYIIIYFWLCVFFSTLSCKFCAS